MALAVAAMEAAVTAVAAVVPTMVVGTLDDISRLRERWTDCEARHFLQLHPTA